MPKSDKPKRPSIWLDSTKPYGTYTGPLWTSDRWAASFKQRMTFKEAVKIVGEKTPLGILGLGVNATWDEIQTAFRTLMQTAHPDKGGTHERAQEVLAAYAILKKQNKSRT